MCVLIERGLLKMKKVDPWRIEFLKRRQILILKNQTREANKKKNFKKSDSNERKTYKITYIDELYKKVKFNESSKTIPIKGSFGIENPNGLSYFFEKSKEILNSRARNIILDLTQVTRIWPSAVTILCSFSHYTKLISRRGNSAPIVQSIHPKNEVGDYLDSCGFNDHVGICPKKYLKKEDGIVKIRREKNNDDVSIREEEIVELVQKYCNYNSDEIEEFDSIVLTEIFNNVTEHGMTHVDKGWWVLAQYHEQHGFISVCIADNGIGIRKTLVYGPQRKRILRLHEDKPENEGNFIQTAAEKINISGAVNASTSTADTFLTIAYARRFPRGARRGRGLKRIIKSCHLLGITLTIISRSGLYQKKPSKTENTNLHSFTTDIFAGTMYHLLIPVR